MATNHSRANGLGSACPRAEARLPRIRATWFTITCVFTCVCCLSVRGNGAEDAAEPAVQIVAEPAVVAKKIPVPTAQDQSVKLALIREIFKEQADAAKTQEQQVELASALLKAARDTDDDDVARFVLLRVARDFAIRGMSVAMFMDAVDEMAKCYQVDPEAQIAKSLPDFLKYARHPDAVKKLGEEVSTLVDEAVQQDRYAHAASLGEVAGKIARKTRDRTIIKHTTLRNNQISELADLYAAVKDSLARLEEDANHPDANLVAGRFYCFQKGDWETGLPMLARGDDKDLAAAAIGDMKVSKTPAAIVKVADRWYDVAQEGKQDRQDGLSHAAQRAVSLYETALSDLTGLARRRAETRLEELLATAHKGHDGPRRPKVPAGAVLVMTFDQDSIVQRQGQTVIQDLSGTNTHGVVHGAAYTDGVFGGALAFDGNSSHVALGNPPTLQLGGSLTISMWLWLDRLHDGRRCPYAKATGGEGTIVVEPHGKLTFIHGTAGKNGSPYEWINSKGHIPPRQWTHVAVVRSSEMKVMAWYFNGVPTNVKKKIKHPVARPSSQSAFVGKGFEKPFVGKIDDLMIFARALSPQEIGALVQRR